MKTNINLLIAIKSGAVDNLTTAYNFTLAALERSNIVINMIFFYQNGSYILLNTDINAKWTLLLKTHNLHAKICVGSYKKRGVNIKEPFKSSSIIEFINTLEVADRVIQF